MVAKKELVIDFDLNLLEQDIEFGKKLSDSMLDDIKRCLDYLSDIYYNGDIGEDSPYSDQDFDRLMEIYNSQRTYSTLTAPRKGKKTIDFTNEFPQLAGTLDKTYNIDEVEDWLRDKCSKLGIGPKHRFELLTTYKYDGNSVILAFNKDGDLESAVTRGKDGKGLNLTDFFKDRKINTESISSYLDDDTLIGIKCEAIIDFDNFDLLNEETGNDYKVPRNTVSGVLNRNDNEDYRKYVSLAPIRLETENGKRIGRTTGLDFFKDCLEGDESFKTIKPLKYFSFKGTIEEHIENLTKLYTSLINEDRENLEYQIDGLVIEFTDYGFRDKLGRSTDRNNYDVALKFPELIGKTEVTDIEFYVSKSSRITPVCVFKPVNFNGAIADHVSLANYRRFNSLELGVGSKVIIEYRGDVMSYLLKDPTDKEEHTPIEFPKNCPLCHKPLEPNKSGAFMFCVNESCDSHIVGKLTNWFIKQDIKGVKENTLQKLVDADKVHTIQDLYELTAEEIEKVDGFKNKSAWNIYNAIHSKEEMFDYELFGSLFFEGFGIRKSKELFKNYRMDDLIDFDKEELFDDVSNKIQSIEGFGESNSISFIEGFENNLNTIKFFLENFLIKDYKDNLPKSSGKSLNIVFTGFRDKEVQAKLEDMGHKVASSVSKKTDMVVTKDASSKSTKIQKARDLGIPILTPEEMIITVLSN